jgi:potassium-transporting ATPase KdpC subunit
MTAQLRPALTLFVLLTVLTGVAYPALVTGIAQGVFPHQANGSVMAKGGQSIGSALIGQPFDGERYFWSRPSATDPFPYNSSSSNASNSGPTNKDWLDAVGKRVEDVRKAHPEQTGPVPGDLVTASASGLDPHISPAAAEYQIARVAKARGKSVDEIRKLVEAHTEGRTFGLLGEPRVNVLKLNLALDGTK